MTTACTELQDALPQNQRQALMLYRGERGVRKTLRRLISKHMSKNPVSAESLRLAGLARRLLQLQSPHLSSVAVAAVDVPGKAVFVTEEVASTLASPGGIADFMFCKEPLKQILIDTGITGIIPEPDLPSAKTSVE